MIVQISSGQGPVECEIMVSKLFEVLAKEYHDAKLISRHNSRFSNYCTSIIFETEKDVSELEGSIQWVCQSPVRPNHRRKNWFVDVSVIPEEQIICTDGNVKFEFFHCGGKGGQNVNKVETGVRAIHVPTRIAVTSTAERSQLLNKKDALEKLYEKLSQQQDAARQLQVKSAWKAHTSIVRGNPTRVYKGQDLIRIK